MWVGLGTVVLVVVLVILFIIGILALLSFFFFFLNDIAEKRRRKMVHDIMSKQKYILDYDQSLDVDDVDEEADEQMNK
jgi:hypothetical protein